MAKSKLLNLSLLLFILVCSFLCIMYYLKGDVLVRHDQGLAWGRQFLFPEHGRYISTFINNLLCERLPNFFHIHTNDFRIMAVSPLKAVISIFICLLLTNAAFIFKKNIMNNTDSEQKIKPYDYKFLTGNLLNPAFICIYILIFLLLINLKVDYISLLENMVFFEYPMSALYYIPFWGCIFFIFTTDCEISKKSFVFLSIITFLLGISVELYNFPTFVSFTLLILYILISKKSVSAENRKKILILYSVFIVSLIVYYSKPHDDQVFYNGTFLNYFHSNLVIFLQNFKRIFLIENKTILIGLCLIAFLILFSNKSKFNNNKKFVFLLTINLLPIMSYILSSFLFGFCDITSFYFYNPKWYSNYFIMILFYLVLSIGYFINANEKINSKYCDIIKISICIIVLIVFNKSLIFDWIDTLQTESDNIWKLRENIYKAEKWAINSDDKYIYMPSNFYELCFHYDTCQIPYFHNANHALAQKEDVKYTDEYDYKDIFTKEELKQLKFTNLLKL